jgi:biopolymer transport protein TolQ
MLQSLNHLIQTMVGQVPDAVAPAAVAPAEVVAPASEASQSMVSYMTEGGPVVIGVLLLLALMSFLSWVLIAVKWQQIGRSARQSKAFAKDFVRIGSFNDVARIAAKYPHTPLAEMYEAARRELDARTQAGTPVDPKFVRNVQRAMERTARGGMAQLEHRLGFLGTCASAAPFIGLFGTVWGIMEAFGHIRADVSVLTTVAPYIAHALIATAVGLATAIPAVIAYNHFIANLRGISVELDGFADDLVNRLDLSIARAASRPLDTTEYHIPPTTEETL